MSVSSLTDVINQELRDNAELRKTTIHRVKIGGDASFDPRDTVTEKESKSASILLLIFAWMNRDADLAPNSTRSHRVVAAAWAKESRESVQTMCGPGLFANEITKLRDEGLDFTYEGVMTKHRFDFYVMGDAKWVRLAYGLGSCASTYGCLFCSCPKAKIEQPLRDACEARGWVRHCDTIRAESDAIDH